jgi:hypothetical protein
MRPVLPTAPATKLREAPATTPAPPVVKSAAPPPTLAAAVTPPPSLASPGIPGLPVKLPEAARPAKTENGLPRLSLEAIAVINGKPTAVINKQKLVAGETIAGARVIRILDYQVELEYQGRRFAIGL